MKVASNKNRFDKHPLWKCDYKPVTNAQHAHEELGESGMSEHGIYVTFSEVSAIQVELQEIY